MNPQNARVLVAGATGYLGAFVAREFTKRGHFVRALARSPEKLDSLRDELDEIVNGELLAFLAAMMTSDMIAPATGSHRIGEYFRKLEAIS
jgi:uncharacterized protein YbjT (DUF2867 family)